MRGERLEHTPVILWFRDLAGKFSSCKSQCAKNCKYLFRSANDYSIILCQWQQIYGFLLV